MSKRSKRKAVIPIPNSKWGRRGKALIDFSAAIIISVSEVIADILIATGKSVYSMFSKIRKKKSANQKQSSTVGSREVKNQFSPLIQKPDVAFEDIAGLRLAKEQIELRMIKPILHPEEAKALKIPQGGGLLLFGPPGNGKTMLAKAVAGRINAVFFAIKPSDLVKMEVGKLEEKIASLFAMLRRFKRVVCFIDEIEAISPSRAKTGSTIMQRGVSQLLMEIDGVQEAPAGNVLLLVGATNVPWIIDPALLRPGRFDVKVYVGLPEEEARFFILKKELKNRPLDAVIDINWLVFATDGYSGADLCAMIKRAAQSAFSRNIKQRSKEGLSPISMADFQLALQEVRPSVSPEELRKYQRFLSGRAI